MERPHDLLFELKFMLRSGVPFPLFKNPSRLAEEISDKTDSKYVNRKTTVKNMLSLALKEDAEKITRPLPAELMEEIIYLVKRKMGEHNFIESNFASRFQNSIKAWRLMQLGKDTQMPAKSKTKSRYNNSVSRLFVGVNPSTLQTAEFSDVLSIYSVLHEVILLDRSFRFFVPQQSHAVQLWRLIHHAIGEYGKEYPQTHRSFFQSKYPAKNDIAGQIDQLQGKEVNFSELIESNFKIFITNPVLCVIPYIVIDHESTEGTAIINISSQLNETSTIAHESMTLWFDKIFPQLTNIQITIEFTNQQYLQTKL